MFLANSTLKRELEEYRAWDDNLIDEIVELARPLEGVRILHLSAAPSRPWLYSTVDALVSLMQSIGIAAERRVVVGGREQIAANRALNFALGGHFVEWTPAMRDAWVSYPKNVADVCLEDYDWVVVHDAELAGILESFSSGNVKSKPTWVWHCHSDLSKVQPDLWDIIMSYTSRYQTRIVSALESDSASYCAPCSIVSPVVDPFDLRNRELSPALVETVMKRHGLDPRRPFILFDFRQGQDLTISSRVIDGFRLAKERMDELQLMVLIVGDGDARRILDYSHHFCLRLKGISDVVVEPLINGIGNTEINALQRGAVAVIGDCSTESDAMLLLEAMWKERPVIVGPESATLLGIEDGQNGWVASSPEDYGERIVRLIGFPSIASAITHAARNYVQERFLVTRLLREYLAALQ